MGNDLVRYSKINSKLPRECILIQGQGCFWKKCTYCDYHLDISSDPFEVNRHAINMITGEYGVLEIMNSGSAPELDKKTIDTLNKKIESCNIHTLWFESHWMYRNHLKKFSANFPLAKVFFKLGIETFDPKIRNRLNKGIPENVTPEKISKFFKGVNILVGIQGQTINSIKSDIKTSEKYFDYIHINVFTNNSTSEKRDEELIKQFIKEVYPECIKIPKAFTFLNANDFGVG